MKKNSLVLAGLLVALTTSPALALEGFGDNVPLSFAVRQIVPTKYDVSFGPDVKADKTVSWKADGDWQHTLKSLTTKQGLNFAQRDGVVKVTVAGAEQTPTADRVKRVTYGLPQGTSGFLLDGEEVASGPMSPEASAENVKSSKAETTANPTSDLPSMDAMTDATADQTRAASVAPAEPSAPPAPSWEIAPGEDLETVLSDWASRVGWTVIWRSNYSYPVEAGATVHGDFVKAATNLADAFQTATPPLYLTFYEGNKVLVISNGHDRMD